MDTVDGKNLILIRWLDKPRRKGDFILSWYLIILKKDEILFRLGGKNLMGIKLSNIMLLVLMTVLLSSCYNQNDENKRPIDGKLSGAVVLRLNDLVGETPVSVNSQ